MKPRWRETVTRIRAVLVPDEYGTPGINRDWTNATEIDIPGCEVQPLPSTEYDAGREAVTTRWRLFAPVDADIIASDRVRVDGTVYEADGDVQLWGWGTPHIEALLKRTVG